jgi:NAD-dependent DNA ligase
MGEGRVPIDIPWRCPTCEGNVDRKRLSSKKKTAKVMDDLYSADIFCLNPECPGKAVGSIMKWVKETKMLGIADGIIGVLYDRGVIKTAADLYRLTLDDLTALPFGNGIFGYPRAKKMLEVIKSRRQVSLPVFLAGLAVPGLGDTKVRDIQTKWRAIRGNSVGKPDHFDHLHSWFSGEGIPTLLIGFAPELGIPNTAKALQAGLDAREGIATALITNGVQIVPETQPEAKEGPLKGVVVCFTGKLPNKESHYADLVRQAGGAVEDDLKSNVTHLVTGDPSKETGKTKKAKAKGIPVWSIDELQARMSPPRQQLTITQPWPENEAAHIEKAHNPELVEDPEGYSG